MPLPRSDERLERVLPALALLILLGGLAIAAVSRQAIIAMALPALILTVVVCARHPAPAVLGVFIITGAINTITVFTPLPATRFADFLLAALWLSVGATYLAGRAQRTAWLWPAMLAALVYLGATALQVLLTDPISLGVASFRASAWYMAAFVLIAIAPWSRETHVRLVKGVLIAALAIGGYSVLRWLIGSSFDERVAARAATPGFQAGVEERFFGSWLSANQLAGWTSTVIPFCLAVGLAWRGRWRLAAFAGIALLAIALLASDVRVGAVAAAVGVAVALGVYLLTPAFPNRVAAGAATLLAIVGIGGIGFALTVGESEEKSDRFAKLLSPTQDIAYTDRLQRWEAALDAMAEEPWGYGLGTSGGVTRQNDSGAIVTANLDSSYLKVGIEQGYPGMLLYALGMVTLLLGLVSRARRLMDPQRAGFAIGGAGSLAALIVLFYAGQYSEGTVVVGAWLLVGLGVAQVTTRDRPARPAQPARPTARSADSTVG